MHTLQSADLFIEAVADMEVTYAPPCQLSETHWGLRTSGHCADHPLGGSSKVPPTVWHNLQVVKHGMQQ
jgi:hypothetical protein